MKHLFFRFMAYFALLILFSLLFQKVEGDAGIMILCAFVLVLVNTAIRPVFTVLALPANIITLGVASVFVNMLTIVISDAIVAGVSIRGFWINLILAIAVMSVDSILRRTRVNGFTGRVYGL